MGTVDKDFLDDVAAIGKPAIERLHVVAPLLKPDPRRATDLDDHPRRDHLLDRRPVLPVQRAVQVVHQFANSIIKRISHRANDIRGAVRLLPLVDDRSCPRLVSFSRNSGSINGMPTLLWFRRDLRLHDLPPLLDAASGDQEVLACYVLDPRLKASSGPRRLQYLYDALRDLRDNLDGRLLVTRGRPEKRIPLLVKVIDATAVHVSADYSPFGRRRDEAVRAALGNVPLEESGSPYLVSPGRVTKGDGTPYKVFTPYYDAWRRHGWRAAANSGPTSARWIDPADVPGGIDIPDAGVDSTCRPARQRPDGSGATFVQNGLADYADDRDRPDLEPPRRMSAHLKFGTSTRARWLADLGRGRARRRTAGVGISRFLRRTFCTRGRESAWWNLNRAFDAIESTTAPGEALFEAWKEGRTGFPIVDAGMRQLAQTGWMHNRVRMIVASFPGQGPPSRRGSAARGTSCTAGRRRHGQQPARLAVGGGLRHRRRAVLPGLQPDQQGRSSTPTASTCGAGCPIAMTTATQDRSSTTRTSARRRCAATAGSGERHFRTPSPPSTGSVIPVTSRPDLPHRYSIASDTSDESMSSTGNRFFIAGSASG